MPKELEQLVSDAQRQQYVDEGYFILESVIPDEHLRVLRDSCDHLIELMHQEMDRLGTDHIHISHRGKRYHIAKKYDQAEGLSDYVFSDLMAAVCQATIGDTAYLFYDQYVAKAAEQGIKFAWHQGRWLPRISTSSLRYRLGGGRRHDSRKRNGLCDAVFRYWNSVIGRAHS